MLDFYINIDNTFLKTSTTNSSGINVSQIYIGFEHEPVGLGYTSNVNISQDYTLNVNGSILAKQIHSPVTMTGFSLASNVSNSIIPNGYLVSSLGYGSAIGDFIKIAGISGAFDSNVMGICNGYNSLYETNISISGKSAVWCDTQVNCGQYLVCSSNNIGVASASSTNIKNNYVFGKSIVNWDPAHTNLYPNITTNTVQTNTGIKIFGLISCIISL
jgi:phosphoribosylformylglycinamidine (FGAM) synthase-like amidotransferase family enzyme